MASLKATDLDGDGDADVLSADTSGNTVAWYENVGGGSFGRQKVIDLANNAVSVDAADLDGDGDADVVSLYESTFGTTRASWYENLGGNAFGPRQAIGSFNFVPSGIDVADLDGDGDADVLVGSDNGFQYQLRWRENLGRGFFAASSAIVGNGFGGFLQDMVATDLDGDGDTDVLVSGDFGCAWFENLGGGLFSAERRIASFVSLGYVCASDLDGDGDADVLSSAFSTDKIVWFENLGGGTFGAERVITTDLDGPISAVGVDLDGDGDPDVLSDSRIDRRIVWYENLGGGGFGPQQVVATNQRFTAALEGTDLDGDGLADALFAEGLTDEIRWCKNLMSPPDCNGNGVPDVLDIANGVEFDCNGNGVPDSCDLAAGLATDCDGNGVLDVCDLAAGALDCNGNGVLDVCDLAAGVETDCDADGILDSCDIAAGVPDCDADGVPDQCQIDADPTLDLDDNNFLDSCEAIGANYCSPAIANSTGAPASILALGTAIAFFGDVELAVRDLPRNTFAMFFTSQTQGFSFPIPGSQGALCVVGPTGRYSQPGQILSSGSSGALIFPIDLSSIPTPTGFTTALPGETWNFQAWYRDANPTVTSNFTDAVSITFQ